MNSGALAIVPQPSGAAAERDGRGDAARRPRRRCSRAPTVAPEKLHTVTPPPASRSATLDGDRRRVGRAAGRPRSRPRPPPRRRSHPAAAGRRAAAAAGRRPAARRRSSPRRRRRSTDGSGRPPAPLMAAARRSRLRPGTTWVHADLDAATRAIRTALDPVATIEAPLGAARPASSPGPRRTDPIEPVMAAPDFPQPMYQPLTELGPRMAAARARSDAGRHRGAVPHQLALRRVVPRRAEPRDGAQAAVERLPDRPARHLLPPLLGHPRRRDATDADIGPIHAVDRRARQEPRRQPRPARAARPRRADPPLPERRSSTPRRP